MDSSPVMILISRRTFISCHRLWIRSEKESLKKKRSHGRELEGNWTALGGVGPLKVFPSSVIIIYLKHKIFADKGINSLGSVTKHVATVPQTWTTIHLFSHSAVKRVNMMQISSSDYTSSDFCGIQRLFSNWSASTLQKGQQSMNCPFQLNNESLMPSTNCFTQAENHWCWNWIVWLGTKHPHYW